MPDIWPMRAIKKDTLPLWARRMWTSPRSMMFMPMGAPQVVLVGHAIEGRDPAQGRDDLGGGRALFRGEGPQLKIEFGGSLHGFRGYRAGHGEGRVRSSFL